MRIMIAGTRSGCGKTTVTCAVLQALINRKMNVTAFKCGPDYIDPMFHSRVIGAKSRNLDGWLCGSGTVNYLLHKNAGEISVIEGVMGYYDGGAASSHTTAINTETPAVIVIDCKGMSESLGAVMKGFLTYKSPNNIAGFIFNRLPQDLKEAAEKLCASMNTAYFGYIPYNDEYSIKSRHLGLVTADEIADLKKKTQLLAEAAEKHLRLDDIIKCASSAKPISFTAPNITRITKNPVRIAVSYDSAFCFYYEDNFDLLRELGCEIVKFSPLADNAVPDGICGLILGGGYPELYAEQLSANKAMLRDIREKINTGLPTIAECGGFMYLCKTLEGADKKRYNTVGVIGADAYQTDKLQRFGYITLTAKNDNLLCKKGGSIRSREFHYWDADDCGRGFNASKMRGGEYECVHASPTLYAGFPHLHFWANIEFARSFVRKCEEYNAAN